MHRYEGTLRNQAAIWAVASVLGFSGVATAQDGEPPAADAAWKVSVGLGAGMKPDYEGSDEYELGVLPDLNISYRDTVFLRGMTLGANAITLKGPRPGDKLQVGPLVRYRMGRDQDDNDALRGLGDVDASVEAGAFIRYGIGRWSVGLTAVQDVASGHDGTLVEASGGYGMPLTESLRANLQASTTWASDNYMESYFGISTAQAARSGRGSFKAEAGVKDVGLSLGLEYDLTEHWGVGGRIGYTHLLGDAADSPIVDRDGSANQFSAGISLRYKF